MKQFTQALPFLILIFSSLSINIKAQIDDSALVDQILMENRNLNQLYADFPAAKKLYKQSKIHKIKGIGAEIVGVLIVSGGAYLTYCGVASSIAGSITQSQDNTGLVLLIGGILSMITGITIIKYGERRQNLAKKIRRGSAQQYIWDTEAKGNILNQEKDLGYIKLDLGFTRATFRYTF